MVGCLERLDYGAESRLTVSNRVCRSPKVLWGSAPADLRQFQVRGEGKKERKIRETVDLVTMPRNFWHWSVSDIDLRQIGACCACSKCGTFLFAPLMVIVLWPQYREKIAQHMLRAIAVPHFPICALKSCPASAALAAGAGHYFSLTAYNLTL